MSVEIGYVFLCIEKEEQWRVKRRFCLKMSTQIRKISAFTHSAREAKWKNTLGLTGPTHVSHHANHHEQSAEGFVRKLHCWGVCLSRT